MSAHNGHSRRKERTGWLQTAIVIASDTLLSVNKGGDIASFLTKKLLSA